MSIVLHGCMYSVKVRRGDYCELAWGCSERVRASGITASSDRPVYSLRLARSLASPRHFNTTPIQHPATNSILPSNPSIVSTLPPRTTDNHLSAYTNPRKPIPTSDKAAQPATMKPVVSAFNAWTWYVASIPRERIHGTCARAGATKTTH